MTPYRGWEIWKDWRGIFHARKFGVSMNTNSLLGIYKMVDFKIESQQGEWIKMNNKTEIALLKDARVRIENYSYGFLCNALIGAARVAKKPIKVVDDEIDYAKDRLLAWITLQLRGETTFGLYIEKKCIKVDWHSLDQRIVRLDWIDGMIRVLENNEPLDTKVIDRLF